MRKKKENISLQLKTKFANDRILVPLSLRSNTIGAWSSRYLGDYSLPMTNAVTNGDFETDLTGWTDSGVAGTITRSTEQSKFGSASIKFSMSSQGGVKYIDIPATNGEKFQVSGWFYRLSGTAAGDVLRASDYGTFNNTVTAMSAATLNASSATWIFGTVEKVAANGGVRVFLNTAVSGTVVFYADGILAINKTAVFGAGNEPPTAEVNDMLTYKGKTFWSGTEPVVINPIVSGNRRYYWPDVSGNNRHLHLINLAYDSTGGQATTYPQNYLFDGVNDYAVYNSATDIVAANGAVSAFVVFRAKDTVQALNRVVYLTDAAGNTSLILRPTNTSFDTFGGSASATSASVAVAPVANKWYSCYFQYDPITSKVSISLNGATVVLGSGTSITPAVKKIVLSANGLASAFNNLREAEVYLFNRILTQAEISSLHNNIAARYQLSKV